MHTLAIAAMFIALGFAGQEDPKWIEVASNADSMKEAQDSCGISTVEMVEYGAIQGDTKIVRFFCRSTDDF